MRAPARVCGILICSALAGGVFAAEPEYPSKPVRFIVGFAPGGGVDIVARMVAQKLGDAWKAPVVVDNRPGAGGSIGAALAVRSPPDGYTLLAISSSYAVVAALQKTLPFDPVNDFAPVTLLVQAPLLLVVHPSLPVHSVKDLVALARSRPARLTYGSGGTSTSGYLAGGLFRSMARVDITHVPYKGAGAAMIDLVGGQISMAFASVLSTAGHVKSQRLRALAVTGAKRSPVFPALPTVAESGVPGYERTTWYGVLAPARTPAGVIERLRTDLENALTAADTRARLLEDGGEPRVTGPKELRERIVSELALARKILEHSDGER